MFSRITVRSQICLLLFPAAVLQTREVIHSEQDFTELMLLLVPPVRFGDGSFHPLV